MCWNRGVPVHTEVLMSLFCPGKGDFILSLRVAYDLLNLQ